jgi:hypothetical protein
MAHTYTHKGSGGCKCGGLSLNASGFTALRVNASGKPALLVVKITPANAETDINFDHNNVPIYKYPVFAPTWILHITEDQHYWVFGYPDSTGFCVMPMNGGDWYYHIDCREYDKRGRLLKHYQATKPLPLFTVTEIVIPTVN